MQSWKTQEVAAEVQAEAGIERAWNARLHDLVVEDPGKGRVRRGREGSAVDIRKILPF